MCFCRDFIPDWAYYQNLSLYLHPKRYILKVMNGNLSTFVKGKRKQFGLTQQELSEKSGVGLRFVRELEQGKNTLRMDKVNQVLALFGAELSATVINKNNE